MNDFLITAQWLSLSGSIFILILYLCKPIVRHKLSKGWQYYIWLIVIARLLLPFSLEVNIWSSFLGNLENRIATQTPQQEMDIEGLPDSDSITTNYNNDNLLPPKESNDYTTNSIVTEVQMKSLEQQIGDVCSVLLIYAWLIWIIVALILFVRKITIYQSFICYIKAGRVEVSDIEHLELLGKLSEQLKIKRTVGLYTDSLISSPILIGFLNPCIILPTAELSEEDFKNTILHELMHYKRLDMLYKWLVQLTICLHWFNPLVYLMGREINRACELSCDEASIRTLNPKEQKAYGDTLLNVLAIGKYNQQIASLSLNEGRELMKERLDSIMNFKKKSVFVRCVSLMLTLVFMCGFAVTGAYAAGNDNQKQSNISRADSLKQNFERYKGFGVIYNPSQDVVYYNGERVKLFVEFKSYKEEGMAYVFDLCYHDSKTNSTLYLEAVKDNNGKVVKIRKLKQEIANYLLDIENTTPELKLEVTPSTAPKKENSALTMDATQILDSYGIIAKDLTKDKVKDSVNGWINPYDEIAHDIENDSIKEWLTQCDNKQGAYIYRTEYANQFITYIYYNGGGRYPWEMSVNGSKIVINLYSDSKLATNDGYYLMCFTAPKEYSDVSLFLDNKQLNLPIFAIMDKFSYAIAYRNSNTFVLENDTTIQISTKVSASDGKIRFIIQPLLDGYYLYDQKVYDTNGKPAEFVYQANYPSGKKVDEIKLITLKAGKYHFLLNDTISPLKNAQLEIIGTIATRADLKAPNNSKDTINTSGVLQPTFSLIDGFSYAGGFEAGETFALANDSAKTTWDLGAVPRCNVKVASENIVVKTGGDSFKIEADEASKDSYTFTDGIHTTSKKREITFKRKTELKPDAIYSSTIYVTIPKNEEQNVLCFISESGNVSVDGLNCSALQAESQSGNVNIFNTKTKILIAKSETGEVDWQSTTADRIFSNKSNSDKLSASTGQIALNNKQYYGNTNEMVLGSLESTFVEGGIPGFLIDCDAGRYSVELIRSKTGNNHGVALYGVSTEKITDYENIAIPNEPSISKAPDSKLPTHSVDSPASFHSAV